MYKIIDKQNNCYFANGESLKTKEAVRQRLASFHSVDWSDEERDINDLTLDELLDCGTWEIEEQQVKVKTTKTFTKGKDWHN